jgi:hypothetical protein
MDEILHRRFFINLKFLSIYKMIEALFLFFLISLTALIFIKEEKPEGRKAETQVECSKVDVKESEHGLGCFANCDIKKEEVVETGVMTRMEGVDGNIHERMFSWSDDRKLFAVGSGCLPFYNHSDEPNVMKIGDLKNDRMIVVALKDIRKGEEMRNRYISKAWRGCFQSF